MRLSWRRNCASNRSTSITKGARGIAVGPFSRDLTFLTPHFPLRRVRMLLAVSSAATARRETCPPSRISASTGAKSAAFPDTAARSDDRWDRDRNIIRKCQITPGFCPISQLLCTRCLTERSQRFSSPTQKYAPLQHSAQGDLSYPHALRVSAGDGEAP